MYKQHHTKEQQAARNATPASKARKNRWSISHPNWRTNYHRLKRYGITPEQYDALLVKQNNTCKICLLPFKRQPSIDHDHKSGKVRGLLCLTCNSAIGMMKDKAFNLQRAIAYLRWSGTLSDDWASTRFVDLPNASPEGPSQPE